MAQNEEQDKTEEATPYKLEQARKKGQVAKSMEINSLASLSIFCLVSFALFSVMSDSVTQMMRRYLIGAGQLEIDNNSTIELFLESSINMITVFSPILGALIIIGIVVTMMQTKPVFSTEALKPNFSKLNPVSGFKRLFSIKMLFELVKTCLKLTAIGVLIYLGVEFIMPDLLSTRYLHANKLDDFWFSSFLTAGLALIAILIPFAILDLIFSKKEYAKKMRMSKREVKEEAKRRDGDPEVRKKRKQIQNELLKRTSSISNVKDSDVIITNPTHYAVALKYQPGKMIAPVVVAKGSDILADKIRRVAIEHSIPIKRQPALTRKIFKETEIDQPILEENYAEVAPIFRWAFDLKGTRY
ncbi:MAG: EscU/YscU/HrcU family type III secretion system export apparatus switch protein [Kangiellaceae bacterium]|nr:EscU/YscU/HrcU family type III secretion system export apparatus switch protein [Kangiellaceae bacterium]MCW9017572.1 EscU/YscU/HrcU family type III secretion system export apparatus switch protein [Kangiellaceae bacterium]